MAEFTGCEIHWRQNGLLVSASSESMPIKPSSAATANNVSTSGFTLASANLPTGVKGVEAQISSNGFDSIDAESRSSTNDVICYFSELQSNSTYVTRHRWISSGGFPSQWSPWGVVTTLEDVPPE